MKPNQLIIYLITILICTSPLLTRASGASLDKILLKEACVRIVSFEREPRTGKLIPAGSGSGFLVDNEGHVVTNFHVSDNITTRNGMLMVAHQSHGRLHLYAAKIVKESGTKDLALLKTSITDSAFLTINEADIEESSEITAVGFPGVSDSQLKTAFFSFLTMQADKLDREAKDAGLDSTEEMEKNAAIPPFFVHSFLKGSSQRYSPRDIQSVLDSKQFPLGRSGVELIHCLEYDANTSPGNSGGPVVDGLGNVVGVVESGGANLKVAISSRELLAFVKQTTARMATVYNERPDQLSTAKIIAISLAGAFALLAIGLSIYMTASRRRPVTGPGVTEIISRLKNDGMLPHGPAAGTPPPPLPLPPLPPGPSQVWQAPSPVEPQFAWELKIGGPGGFSQTLRMTDREFRQGRGRVTVGRSGEFSQLAVNHDSISRQHFHIEHRKGALLLVDRNSSNGTRVNKQSLTVPFKEHPLREGDVIEAGDLSGTLRRSF